MFSSLSKEQGSTASLNSFDKDCEDKNSENDNSECQLLTLTDPPIYFEPISSLTNVFFDRDNQQIFCVRSNGVGGVIVKGSRPELNLSFRMEDKGNVATIKFSPNLGILAIRRKDKCVIDFLNFKNSQPIFPEYSQSFKAKTSKFQECYWLDSNEILFVSEQGFEHYQIFPEKRALKLVKFFSMNLNWLIWSKEAQSFIVSTGVYGSTLNPFVYTKGAFIKLPKFEVDLPLPLNLVKYRYNDATTNNPNANNRYYLNESDVVVGKIYNEFYVMIIRQMSQNEGESKARRQSTVAATKANSAGGGFSEIAMYKLLTDNPAKKTNILKINLAGRFTLNIIDELIIVHHRTSYSSMIFDIKMQGEFDGYVTCNQPIIKKASIQSADIPLAHSVNENSSNFLSPSPASSNSSVSLNEMYSMNWIMFLPNVIIDAKLGLFWYMELNLKNADLRPFVEFGDDYLKLIEFLLNRKNTKKLILKVCDIAIRKNSSLKVIEKIFDKVNEFYKFSLMMFPDLSKLNNENVPPTPTDSHSLTVSSTSGTGSGDNKANSYLNEKNELPIIEQYDMHNSILYKLTEDDKWWSQNSKYTVAIIIEYFRSLNVHFIQIEHYLYKLLVNALIKSNRLYQLHQYLQYHVLSDSKPLACLLLSIQSTYPAANQIALDMLKRLGTANEEIVDVLLSQGLILSALKFGILMGLGDTLNPGKFLETAKDLNDSFIYYEVFKYFEERNMRLRGNPNFRSDEMCEAYVRHFMSLFQNKTVLSPKN